MTDFKLRVGAASHRGKVREENQDRISRFRGPLGEVFLVVDGMGGHQDGARAAEIVITGFEKHLRAAPDDAEITSVQNVILQDAATRTNAELYALSAGAENKMGATLVLVLIRDRRAVVAHAGDSRAYLMRGGTLSPWTHDHTRVQQMLDHGMLTEEEARHHPDASVITRAFGQQPEIELEISEPRELRSGDRILLCSDGLCGYVDDAAIARGLEVSGGAQEATNQLIELALEAGGEDNVSVQVVRIEDQTPAVKKRRRRHQRAIEPADADPAATDSAKADRVKADLATANPTKTSSKPAASGRLRVVALALAAVLVAVLVAVLAWSLAQRGGSETVEETEKEDITLPSGETS